jgi:hypothetical protein
VIPDLVTRTNDLVEYVTPTVVYAMTDDEEGGPSVVLGENLEQGARVVRVRAVVVRQSDEATPVGRGATMNDSGRREELSGR